MSKFLGIETPDFCNLNNDSIFLILKETCLQCISQKKSTKIHLKLCVVEADNADVGEHVEDCHLVDMTRAVTRDLVHNF